MAAIGGHHDQQRRSSLPPSDFAPPPPVISDRLKIILVIFFLHGISALLPWNMLINADSYFVDYKLNGTIGENGTSVSGEPLTDYRRNFLSYLSTASKAPNIVFQLINLLFSTRSYRIRMNVTFLVQIGLFVIMIALAIMNTSSWPEGFFWTTMTIAVLFNMVNGIFQSCMYAIAAKFPMEYINSVTLGFTFSGVISSIFLIVSLLLSPHPRTVAIYYFTFATVFMIICYVNELVVVKNRFFRYYFYQEHRNDVIETYEYRTWDGPTNVDKQTGTNTEKKSDRGFKFYWEVTKKCWVQLLNVVLVPVATFAIFPAIQAAIRPVDSLVEQRFFVPIFCFLFFNLFGAIGNILAERIRKPGPKRLIYCVLLRFLFIPFFLYCNYRPEERTWPVLIRTDLGYAFGSALLAFTNGYTTSLSMMYTPKCVPDQQAPGAAMMASATIIVGIVIGVQFSILLQNLVTG